MTTIPVQMMDESGERASRYTADRQVGKKGNCYVAQVFGPHGDSVLTVDPTDDPAEASRIAAVCAAALSAPVAPVPELTPPQQATPAPTATPWQPMRTAPKDGAAVLVLIDGSDLPYTVRWRFGEWQMAWDSYSLTTADGPRYWMPVPADPAATPTSV